MFFIPLTIDISVDTIVTDPVENKHFIQLSRNGIVAG